MNKDFENIDCILHEMGIPPIHTPKEILADMSDNVKDHMYLVHVSESAIPKNCGLKSGPVGLLNTIRLLEDDNSESLLKVLTNLCSIPLFEKL